jgi:hypothetical protein
VSKVLHEPDQRARVLRHLLTRPVLLGVTVGELAAQCGLTTPTVFSRAQEMPLSAAVRRKLDTLKHEAQVAKR